MTIEEEKQMLERLIERKEKAESMPPDQLEPYRKQYNAICQNIEILSNKLGIEPWNGEKALGILAKVASWCNTLDWRTWDKEANTFYRYYPDLEKEFNEAGEKVDALFRKHDMQIVRQAIEEYKSIIEKINKAYLKWRLEK